MKLLLTFLTLLVATNTFAQYIFPEKELCEELKKRTLAVQLINEKSDLDKNTNNTLKEVFNENWDLTPIEFVTPAESKRILKEKDTKYVVLTQKDEVANDERTEWRDSKGNFSPSKEVVFTFAYYGFDLKMPTEKKAKIITSVGMANGDLSRIDYLFLTQQLNKLIKNSLAETPMNEFYNVDRNIEKCQNYTLVILKDFIKEKEIDKISELYPHNYELVDFKTYEDIVLNKTPKKGYIKIIWSNQIKMYEWIVIDAQNGDILSQMSFGGIKFGSSHKANEIINVKHLKHILNKTGQKMNNRYK